MSAPHDSIMNTTDDNTNTADNTRLTEPSDSVPMDNMQQPQDKDSKTDNSHTEIAQSQLKKEGLSTDSKLQTPVKDQTHDDDDIDSGKGKDKAADASTSRPPLGDRADSINAIGAAVDEIKNLPSNSADPGPVCNITLLLTTGSRHPYKLDSKYLSKRNVQIPEETEDGHPDPFSISIYTLKELILREWRSDWESKPPSPTSIRLIHFGKLLDDKEPLKSKYLEEISPFSICPSVF